MKILILMTALFSLNTYASETVYVGVDQQGRAVYLGKGESDQKMLQVALKSAVQNALNECEENYSGTAAATVCVTDSNADSVSRAHRNAHLREAVVKVSLYCRTDRKNVSTFESVLFERDGTNFSDCAQRVSVKNVLKNF